MSKLHSMPMDTYLKFCRQQESIKTKAAMNHKINYDLNEVFFIVNQAETELIQSRTLGYIRSIVKLHLKQLLELDCKRLKQYEKDMELSHCSLVGTTKDGYTFEVAIGLDCNNKGFARLTYKKHSNKLRMLA